MSAVHGLIIIHVRTALEAGGTLSGDMTNLLTGLDDDQIIRVMFLTTRGRGAAMRGLRLTRNGLEIMQALFASHSIQTKRTREVSVREILYLERRTSKPYFIDRDHVVLFDEEFALLLRMVDGDIAELMSNES